MGRRQKKQQYEQNHDLFSGVIQGVAGESDLAVLDPVAAVDGDRAGGNFADHIDRLDHGPDIQQHTASDLFLFWLLVA